MAHRAAVPTDTNLAPPIRYWTYLGGAYYDPDEDCAVLPAPGAVAHTGLIRVDGSRWIFAQEERQVNDSDPWTGICLVNYFDVAQRPHVVPSGEAGNGFGPSAPGRPFWWERRVDSAASPPRWDAGLTYVQIRVANHAGVYATGPTLARTPTLTVTR